MQIPTISYWNNTGRHQNLSTLLEDLVPDVGAVENVKKNRKLEKFRKASNCYYDLYNNGLGNRASEFYNVFKIASTHFKTYSRFGNAFESELFVRVEAEMDNITLAAAVEQGVIN